MTTKQKACSALTAVFPNKDAVADFIKDGETRNRLQSFINFAARHHLIRVPTREAFDAFIDANSRPSFNTGLNDLTMDELIDSRKKYLNTRLSNSALTDKINALLEKNAVDLPPLSSAMFTRLKNQTATTPRRRDALRSFAFWIGHERGDLGNVWHYETLKMLCRDNDGRKIDASCGIRIAFSISGRGNIIDQDILTWMKKTIKKTLNARTDLFPNGNRPRIRNYDVMTFQVDLPNGDQSTTPPAYANTLKTAITISHQIAIQWIISQFSTYSRFFSIGIAAGSFDEINSQLQAVLNVKLPEDPIIRMTDYARQCAMISQIKIIMNHIPKEIELVSGETLKVWWITELSGMIYWDLVPEIISDNFWEKNFLNPINLRRLLIIPTESDASQAHNAISCFFKSPNHSMLGFEIVRTLLCKGKFSESLEILNALLRVTPNHLNSRIMRMTLYKFLGMEAEDYCLSDMMFRMAEKEADYIVNNISHAREEFYYEYGLLKLARLSAAVKALRQHGGAVVETMNLRLATPDLMDLLIQAEEIVMQGIIVSSPTMERIIYLYQSIQVLKCVLNHGIKEKKRINSRLTCPNNKIKDYMAGIFLSQHQQTLKLDSSDLTPVMQFIDEAVRHDERMIAMEAFRPAQFFIGAVFYWDILPMRNVAIIKETLNMLKNAIKSARAHVLSNKLVYTMANLSGQFVSARQFSSQVEVLVREIEKRYRKAAELEKLAPNDVIGPHDDDLVLMTYHV